MPVAPVLRNFQNEFVTKIAALELAEKWDNVGFLIETRRSAGLEKLRVLTCIDMTKSVVEEAEQLGCNLILAYHPILFRAVHSLSMSQNSHLLHCLDSNISVFSPHTALDSASGGVNDHLCDTFLAMESTRSPVRVDTVSGANIGRISEFKTPVSLQKVIDLLKQRLNIPTVRYSAPSLDFSVSSVAVCVGSGASVLTGAPADVYLTGEMSHHEILACRASGKAVILLDHSSSERPFLEELARRVSEFECVESVVVSEEDVEPISSC
jgi:dinuclear metal center YbgI/SA1388 family protein